MVEALVRLDELVPRAQDPGTVTYAAKIDKSEAQLDWNLGATLLDRQVRAFDPFPGAETTLEGEPLKVWLARPVAATGAPGCVIGLDGGCPVVACGTGALVLTVLQRPGSRRMPAEEFLKARSMAPGTRLGATLPGSA